MKKNKTLKRFLAFLLCAAMLITYMPSSTFTFADETADDQQTVEEANTESEAQKETEAEASPAPATAPEEAAVEPEPAEEPAPAVEETEPADTSEEAGDETRAGPEEETVVEEPTEEKPVEEATVEEPKEEKADDKDKLNEETLTFTKKANSVNVKVVAAPGTFPVGTEMKVTSVAKSEVRDAVEDVLDDVKDFRAVDITFYKDGKEVQPKKNVSVKLSTSALDADEDLSVVHVEDNGAAEVMNLTKATDTMAQFKTDGFSVYVVVETGDDARLKVDFVQSEKTVSMYVKEGDNLAQVLYDPGAGNLGSNSFHGYLPFCSAI